MITYRVGGLLVSSTFPLPELREVTGRVPEWSLEVLPAAALDGNLPDPVREAFLPDGRRWLSVTRSGGVYRLRFWSYAEFELQLDARRVACRPEPNLPDDTLRHLFIDQIVPLLLSASGRTAVHASAVLTEWGAVGFLGESGMGKSTLAGSFAAHGFPALADDCLVLTWREGRMTALPMYPGLRLWPDSFDRLATANASGPRVAHYGVKRRLVGADLGADAEEVPLAALFLLDGTEPALHLEVEPARGRQAFVEVFSATYRLDPGAADHQGEFESVNRLVEAVPIARLRFRRDFALLPEIRAGVLEFVERLATAARAPGPR